MSRKKKGSVPVQMPKEKKKTVINMNRSNLKKTYIKEGFRTGGHMTERDRPRKKGWLREYRGHDDDGGSFFVQKNVLISIPEYSILIKWRARMAELADASG